DQFEVLEWIVTRAPSIGRCWGACAILRRLPTMVAPIGVVNTSHSTSHSATPRPIGLRFMRVLLNDCRSRQKRETERSKELEDSRRLLGRINVTGEEQGGSARRVMRRTNWRGW